jgi:thiamine biosynthesis lipoprotein
MYFRKSLQYVFLIRSGCGLLLFYFAGCGSVENLHHWSGTTMGTTYQVKILSQPFSEGDLIRLRTKIDSALIAVNQQMSTYDPASEISRFNDFKDTTTFTVSPDFANVVSEAMEISVKSGYTFDITVAPLIDLWGFGKNGNRIVPPSESELSDILRKVGSKNLEIIRGRALKKRIPSLQINLGAIAKGYGVDVVARILFDEGLKNYLVEIGGEVFARGLNDRGELWKIGIDNPDFASLPGQDIQAILQIDNNAVATSGDYRNYFEYEGKIFSHTIDPRTGKPVSHNLASVTIVAKTCMQADALATALMVMGKEKGLTLIESTGDAEAFLIIRKDIQSVETFQSSGFSQFLVQ